MTRSKNTIRLAILFAVCVLGTAAQTTEFTYQGNLVFNGQPATGNYDFEFSLFSAFSGGTQIGQTLAVTNVAVNDGVFMVPLNFGSSFPGADRFLEIKVRTAGGGAYTPLTPRQPITSSPYAIKSQSAETAVNAAQLGGVAANQYVLSGDARLSDARNPLPNSTNYVQNGTTQQASANFNITGNGTVGGALSGSIVNATAQFNWNGARILSHGLNNSLFVGLSSGVSQGTGAFENTYVGTLSGRDNIDGDGNTMVGSEAGKLNTASGNTFVGESAGSVNTWGERNSFFGRQSGSNNSIGSYNAFFAPGAGGSNTEGNSNSFFGFRAGVSNTTGDNNSFFGQDSGLANILGSNNTVVGALANVGSGNLNYASAIGAGAIVTTSNTVVLGRAADTVFVPGAINTQQYNIGGQRVLAAPSSANTFVGLNSGQNNAAGFSNTFVGTFAGQTNSGGDENSFFGKDAGISSIGNQNTFIGTDAGQSNTTGSGNSALGAGANVGSGTLTNATAIGAGAVVTFSDTIQLGRDTLDSVRIGRLGSNGITAVCLNGVNGFATCSSSARYKYNINDYRSGSGLLNKLRPVTFNWTAGNAPDLGLVAEEVAAIDPLLVTYNDKGEVEGVKYDRIGVVLINTVKEQHLRIEQLERELAELKKLIEDKYKEEKR
ncbi:MAG: tail fiber domain-containing protein [Pyrinomonadaceae bacterium]|nr:tail fiber domain-containing protein [Pyrinomonadaceae bacterium]